MTDKALHDIGGSLEQMKKNKAYNNDASFSEIEKEKYRLDRVL